MGLKCPKCQTDNPETQKFCGECATPLPSSEEVRVTETLETPTEELTRGTIFADRYEIIEELGKGGMGKVYRVEDKKLKQEVALKLIKPEVSSDKKTIERFRNELKTARMIRHKNVCGMYDLGEEKGTHFITMEYVPGEDLRSMIRMSKQMSVATSIDVAKQVCEGLAEAHRLGVVHRDLKPSNIMIDKEGNSRIMDFGIARSIKGKGITGAGVMIGTPEYMSPEQVEGKEIDQRSDIYSLGIILYEMVTGRVPFRGDTPLNVAVKQKTEAPEDPKKLNSQIPDDLSHVILRCLEKNKENRYQSGGEVHTELTRIEKGIPTTEKVIPKRKPITSKEITVTFGLKKLFILSSIVVILAIIAGVVWQFFPKKETATPPPELTSIAVLPFADLSQKKDQAYFCDGMTDEIIARLSRLEDWKVISRTSVMRYKSTDKDIKEIGHELDVATILEGSIRKEEDDIRITAQLINVKDGFQLWSDTYDQKLERIFVIQSDIAEKIAEALKMKLSPEDEAWLQKKPTENLEAYNLYLKGRWFWNKRTEEGIRTAIKHFEEVIEKDPEYALAYSGLADSWAILPNYGSISSAAERKEAYSKAEEAAIRALEINDELAEARASLGSVKESYWDWTASDREYRRAIELNPGYATAHHWYAYNLVRRGLFDEALEEIKKAQALDPLSLAINRDVGMVYYYSREYDKAIETLQNYLEMEPNSFIGSSWLLMAYLQKRSYKDALALSKKLESPGGLAFTYIMMGERDKGLKLFEDVLKRSKGEYLSPWRLAAFYFALGEDDQGFMFLNKAYEEQDFMISLIKVDPLFDGIRLDPRYKALLKKMNLE